MKNEIGPCEGNCPVQSEGFINDHPYYFRARGSHWTFAVAPVGEEAGWPYENSLYYKAGYIGEWPAAGWLPVKDAEKIVSDCAQEFRDGKRGTQSCECAECVEWRGMTQEQRIEKTMKDYEDRSNAGIEALKKFRKEAAEEN